jgi:hypothetical protein
MIAEYAITPEVFSPSAYATPEASRHYLSALKDGLRSRGLVRNLYSGGWLRFVEENRDRWDMSRIKELLKIIVRDRLCDSPACSDSVPSTPADWCQEALESHTVSPLQGIIADQPTADLYDGENLIAPATQLTEKTWWLGGKNSVELKRSTEAYLQALGPTLRHSKSIMFIDPHLDPKRDDYQDFVELLKACGTRTPAPKIEIHRVCYSGSGRERQIVSETEWRQRFDSALGKPVRQMGLQVEVFLWDDFHDRYLISNLIGILIPNGFDTESNPSTTRWARLDREHRDSVQKEFHPAGQKHTLRNQFVIG